MYSYTATGVNSIHPVQPNAPKLRIRCKCNRELIQEEIYTCISCTNYSCHFCTIPDISYFQCRNCKAISQQSRSNKCKMCFSCPYCSNVLVPTKSSNKKFILICNFCSWNTQQIQLQTEKPDQLIQSMNKLSSTIRENENNIYIASQDLFKDVAALVQHQNQLNKISRKHKKNQQIIEIKNQKQKLCQSLIKRTGLEDNSQEYGGDLKIPQNLPLLAKKTRRCPNCKKPLTTTYQTRTGEQKTELMYKDLKVLQCQRKPSINGSVKIRCLRGLILEGNQDCKTHDIKEVKVNQPFKVKIEIVNRTKQAVSQIEYQFIVNES